MLEPRRRSLVILPYGTMAAVVESTGVGSVLVYDCCEHFALACVEMFGHPLESDSTSHILILWPCPAFGMRGIEV